MHGELDQVLQDFLIESQENLERLERELMELEQEPDNDELIRSVFRIIHSIKGNARFLNLIALDRLAHRTEDVLAKLRDHSLLLNAEVSTVLLGSVDIIKSMLLHLKNNRTEGDFELDEILRELSSFIGDSAGNTEKDAERAAEPVAAGDAEIADDEAPIAVVSNAAASAVTEGRTKDIWEAPGEEAQSPADSGKNALPDTEESRIHVDVGLLDHLMNLTGELVLARNRVLQCSSSKTLDADVVRDVAQHLHGVVSDFQELMLKTRMQPVRHVFGLLPRLVQDLSRTSGKDVDLRLDGQDTELDRTLLEAIKDPLLHIVRNAVDHGIELPEIRREKGKPKHGVVALRAYHEGGYVHIDVTNDGAEMDRDRIKAKAIAEDIITAEQGKSMSDRDVLQLIFRPGFSTSETVTNVSGRGVGMDVVKRNVDRIGGIIEVRSDARHGTTVQLRLPITLAIVPVLMVHGGEQRFAIPQVHLEELITVSEYDDKQIGIERISGAEVFRLRGELIPVLRLREALQLPDSETASELDLVVVSAGIVRFGIVVDEVGDTEEIVVKPLSHHVKEIACYEGATIMGDGDVALILNVSGLFATANVSVDDINMLAAEEDFQAEHEAADLSGEQRQTIVLFQAGKGEYYGVPLAFVLRLEDLYASQIERSGGREVLQYRSTVLPLMRLEPYLNIEAEPDGELLSMIVFSVEKQIGLVVKEIQNTMEISTQIDTETFNQKGILGSTVIEGHSVLILDIHGLIEMAYPAWYKRFFVSTLNEEDRRKIRILLVEDSPFFMNIEKSYLQSAGYQVLTAEHGKQALEVLETSTVDAVVTDIDMPYCNGFELTQAIRAREYWAHLPVMAVTSLSADEDRKRGQHVGIDEYQVKLDREDVLRALEALIIKKRKSRQT